MSRHFKSTDLRKVQNDDSLWWLNNLLTVETVATLQQLLGNALVTYIPEHSKDELHRPFTTSIAPDQQK